VLALAALPAAYLVMQRGWASPRRIKWLLAASLLIGAYSILTGDRNGLTDEPYTTPLYNTLLPNLYGHPLAPIQYVEYGHAISLGPVYDVYLPFLGSLVIPFVDYRWTALFAWFGMAVWLRHRPFAALSLAAPYVAVLAANGFNDLVALFFLTLALVPHDRVSSKISLVLALGAKQFCPILAVVYYALQRNWRWAIFSAAITGVILLPFYLQSPAGTVCHAVLSSPLPCGGSYDLVHSRFFVSHVNYWLYPLWILALFGPAVLTRLRRAFARNTARELPGAPTT
jgi:hypothetical protein